MARRQRNLQLPAARPWTSTDVGIVALQAMGLATCLWLITRAQGTSDEALSLFARCSARAAFLAFALAFAARPLHELAPRAPSAWLRGHRPAFGVAFALAHFTFLATNVTRVFLHRGGDFLALRPLDSWVLGGALYIVIAAMALTSFPAPARVLGQRRWRLLHRSGSWFIASTFLASFGLRALHDPFYVPPALVGIGLFALRAGAYLRADEDGLGARLRACAARCLGGA